MKFSKILLINYAILICFCLYLLSCCHAERSERQKRYLTFPVNTTFFVRFNIKENVINWTDIFAQSQGFKFTYHMPTNEFSHIYHRIGRRDLHGGIETLINSHGFDGKSCITLARCLAHQPLTSTSKILQRFFKILFRSPETTDPKFYTINDCQEHARKCPLTQMTLAPNTDV